MVRARITSKGQVTVPVEIRRRLELRAGDEIVFEADRGQARLWPLRRKRLSDLYGALPATKPYPDRNRVRTAIARDVAGSMSRRRGGS